MKSVLLITIIFLNSLFSFSQGLENIVVELYYVSNEKDAGELTKQQIPEGLVTYRVYVDMKPGYNLQSVFGSPGHEMRLSTSTYFYNHIDHGSYIPNLIFDRYLGESSVMLDTWISMGGGSQDTYAILKSDDDTLNTVASRNTPPVLQNEDLLAGIPLKLRDGLKKFEGLPPRITQVGLDSLLLLIDKKSTSGTGFSFATSNGGWGCIGGSRGYNPETNVVCIGQFSTTGEFNFEFNIQIGSPEYGVEQYVARNPTGSEQLNAELIINMPAVSGRK